MIKKVLLTVLLVAGFGFSGEDILKTKYKELVIKCSMRMLIYGQLHIEAGYKENTQPFTTVTRLSSQCLVDVKDSLNGSVYIMDLYAKNMFMYIHVIAVNGHYEFFVNNVRYNKTHATIDVMQYSVALQNVTSVSENKVKIVKGSIIDNLIDMDNMCSKSDKQIKSCMAGSSQVDSLGKVFLDTLNKKKGTEL